MSRPSPATPPATLIASNAHLRRFQEMIAELSASGQDATSVALLNQLITSLPHLRAALPAEQRRLLDELDANETALSAAFQAMTEALAGYSATMAERSITHLLIDASALLHLAELLHQISQIAGDGTLRAKERARLLNQLT